MPADVVDYIKENNLYKEDDTDASNKNQKDRNRNSDGVPASSSKGKDVSW